MNVSLMALETSMPEKVVHNDFFGDGLQNTKNKMFLGTVERRHIDRDMKASDLIVQGAKKLIDRLDLDVKTDIDIIITNVSVPDEVFTGCGAVVRKELGSNTPHIYDMHNTGCVAFVNMIELARGVMMSSGARSALLCTVQSAAGRLFALPNVRIKPQAAIPGDGCGIGYLTAGDESPVLQTVQHCYPEFSEDMYVKFDCGRKYWESGKSDGYIDFNEAKIARITIRGNRLVPNVVKEVCEKAGIKTTDIDILVTNQPNTFFLRNWREALQLPEDKHIHTFEKYANLFGAGIPVSMAEAIQDGRIKKGDMVCIAGFSHAGDYASASLIRWGGVA